MFQSLQVCGTSGSGKTTLVRKLLELSNAEPIRYNHNGKKPTVYSGLWQDERILFLGSYETTCGGCDTIPSVRIVAELLQSLDEENRNASGCEDAICIFEGLMISHMVGTVGAMQVNLGLERHHRAYLSTPIGDCLSRVINRRLAAGNNKPFNPLNTQKDWPRVMQCKFNCEKQGFNVHTINYECAWDDFTAILEGMINGRLSAEARAV